jgi:protein subunit release factor B
VRGGGEVYFMGNHKNNSQVKMNFGVTRKKQEELEARMAALGLREADLQEKYIRSSGPGGQNVNKTASCVYLKHIQTGLEVKMQRERSQGLNRYYARKRLCELVEQEKMGTKSPAALKADAIRKQKQRRRRRSKTKR